MKMINPEKSCIVDVSDSRAEELKRYGYERYTEPEAAQATTEKITELPIKAHKKPENKKTTGSKSGKNKTSKK